MTWLEAIALGTLQGLTEFFPVSSSGHLVLAEALLDVDSPGLSLEVLVHLATVLSVLVLYRERLYALIIGLLRRRPGEVRYLGLLILASVPAGLAGTTLSDAVARVFDLPLVAAISLLVTGFIVYATRWLGRRADRVDPGWAGALAVGLAQALALVPGISRSGITVMTAMGVRTEPEAAAEFSFLLSVPAILGASALELPELLAGGTGLSAGALVTAAVSAFLAGLLAISLFVRWLRRGSFYRFAYYCWAIGLAFIVYSVISGGG